jgi:S-(hydroxymethyl)glutathione dehydrogenase/alcohol dehydrogenase
VSALPRTARAAILVQQKQPLELAAIDLPERLEAGQVLVKLAYSGICGSQLGEIDGVKGPDAWLPHLLGHEGSGHVLAVGPGVRRVKAEDTVVMHWRPAPGIEAATPKYSRNGQTVNAGWVTTFNEFAIIAENRLTPIPASTDLRAAALYGCAVTTGFGVIDNRAHVKLGETVVVFGAGGIGLNIIQAAALAGASTVVAVDLFSQRLALAQKMGATQMINAATTDAWARIAEIFGAKGPDVFIDNTGSPEIIGKGYSIVSKTGRVILVGVPKKGQQTPIDTLQLHFGKSIIGTTGGEVEPSQDIPRYMALMAARKIDLNELITEVGSLDEVNDLIGHMRSGTSAGRCLIAFKAAA